MGLFAALFVFVALPVFVYVLFVGVMFGMHFSISKKITAAAESFHREGDFPVTVLVVGDSLGVGVGSYGRESIAERIALMLNASVENRSVSGAKMQHIEAQIQQSTAARYDYVFIIAGANDVLQFTADGVLKDAIRASYGAARLKSDRVVALTAGDIGNAPFFVFPLSYYFSKRSVETRPYFVDIAKEIGVEYINLMEYPDTQFADVPKYYAADLLHLSSEGYGVWFEHIKERIQQVWNVEDKAPKAPQPNTQEKNAAAQESTAQHM